MNKREMQKENTRSLLLKTAKQMFAENGLLNVKTLAIAKKAGLSHGTLFSHFKTREVLLETVIESFGLEVAGQINILVNQNSNLEDILRSHIKSIKDNESFYISLISEAAMLPINIIMIWYRLTQTENFSTTDMTVYPIVFGGGTIILILLLNKILINNNFKETFNSGKGIWYWDILIGIGLTIIYFTMFFIERATLYQWIPNNNPPNTELIDTMVDLANNPLLMIVWFGPVLWIGIALFEELSRIFLLKCLWDINEDKSWHIIAIVLASALIGVVHLYQGLAGIISIGIKSIIMSFYFYKYRRLLLLIISHGLYDGLQFVSFILQFRY